jgi:hypothetical protein
VQALRYEELDTNNTLENIESDLLNLLLQNSVKEPTIAHAVHWHLFLEQVNDDNCSEI